MRIGLAYNEKPDPAPDAESDSASDAFAEWDDPSTIAAVEQALGLFGSVIRLEADQFFPQNVVLARPDLVFNMAEGLHGQSREALVPAICEYLNIPYTGSDPLTLALSLHKGRTKETLAYRGVPTAPFTCIEAPQQIERMALTYPVFVKPVAEGSGKGVFAANLCANAAALRKRARRLPRARLPRLVPRGPAGGPVRRPERPGAEPVAGDHSRSGHELLLSEGGARRGVRLRRAHPGSGPPRLAPADGTGVDPGGGTPPRRVRPPTSGGGRVKIAILFDPGAEDWTPEDIRGVMKAVDEIGAIFAAMGHAIRKVPVRHDMRWFQVARRADLVFNLCEGVHGKSEWEEHVVGTLEFAGIPITGASLWTLAACRRKPVANALLQQAGLPIPRWTVAQGKIEDDFPLPAIVKPAAEDASAGLDRGSVVNDRKCLRARVAAMTEQFDEVLVQEYIGGREFTVGLVGTRVLPIAETDFSRMPEGAWPILTYAGKWELGSADDLGSAPVCPAGIAQKLADRLIRIAELAWRTMQGKGYGRVDLRVDDQGRPWVLEVNPNPDLNDDAGLSRMAKVAGWDYAELVRRIAEVALREAQGAKAARELLAPSRRLRATRTA